MSRSAAVSERVAKPVPQAGSARRPGLFRALRSEALKSSHGAPVKVAIALALPFPLLFGPLSGRVDFQSQRNSLNGPRVSAASATRK